MKYIKSNNYDEKMVKEKIMGPNPIKLEEELLQSCRVPSGSFVLDLGSGTGLTSVFLVKEYGFRVIAADLWSNPTDNKRFFDQMGLNSLQIMPLHADAESLPFANETFDAVVSVDSYNYFGREKGYLEQKLLPYVKKGGYIYAAVPGMKQNFNGKYPPELLLSWTSEQLDYIQNIDFWKGIIEGTEGLSLVKITEMESNEEVWNDWLSCDNEYAVGDRKSMQAGAGKYLNFISIVLRKE